MFSSQITDANGFHPNSDLVFSFTVVLSATNDTYPQTVIGNVSINSANIPYSVTTNDAVDAAATISFAGWNLVAGVTENGGTVSMVTSDDVTSW